MEKSTSGDNITTTSSSSFNTATGVDPFDMGYATAYEDIQKTIEEFGRVVCKLLILAPNSKVSVAWPVPNGCKLILSLERD